VHEQNRRDNLEAASRNALQRAGILHDEHRGDHVRQLGELGVQPEPANVAPSLSAAVPPLARATSSRVPPAAKPHGGKANTLIPTRAAAAANNPPSPQMALNVHTLFQGGGGTFAPATLQPPASAPAQAPVTSVPTWPGAPAYPGRDAVTFPRSPQIARPPLAGMQSGSGGPSPAALQRKVREYIKVFRFLSKSPHRCLTHLQNYLNEETLERTIIALENLPDEHQHIFVENIVNAALEGGSEAVGLTETLLATAHSQRICAPRVLERGFLPAVEAIADTSIDLPRAYEWLTRLMYASGMTKARVEKMAEKVQVTGEPRLLPKYLLAYEFEKIIS
jgi:hypothetical protein